MKKVIKNVGLLDIRNATEESINNIERISNVGSVIYSRETAHFMTKLNFGNLGSSMEVPKDCKILTGQVEINKGYMSQLKEPLSLLITGQVIFKNDMDPEDIENGFKSLQIVGQVFCPEKLMSVIQSKGNITGQIFSYADKAKILIGKIKLDEHFLNSLDENTSLFITGKMEILDEISHELLDKKIKNIQLIGKGVAKEEYAEIFNRKLENRTACKIEIIPEGFTYLAQGISLNRLNIKRFDNAMLYCPQGIIIDADLKVEELKAHISEIIARDGIVCREDMADAAISLCKDPLARILTYKNRLVLIEEEYMLTHEELEYSTEGITFIVKGELHIDMNIDPGLLSERIDCIDNFGEITVSKKHYGIIQNKIRTREGELINRDVHEEASDDNTMGNVGYLTL